MNERHRIRLRLRNEEPVAPEPTVPEPTPENLLTSIASDTETPSHNNLFSFSGLVHQIRVPKILGVLELDWETISKNLGLDVSSDSLDELEYCFQKHYYSTKGNTFEKSFGFKTKNLYDLGYTSINQINDYDLVVDTHGFAFSYFDLKKLDPLDPHPYLREILLGETKINSANLFPPTSTPNSICSDLDQIYTPSPNISSWDLYTYYDQIMSRGLRTDSSFSSKPEPNLSEIFDQDLLEQLFESAINHEFYTNSLVSIYRESPTEEKSEHLDYTVALLYYVVSMIDDLGTRYRHHLIDNYGQMTSQKYLHFLRQYIYFLSEIKQNYNLEKYHYVSIIIFKILQYRFQQIQESQRLYHHLLSFLTESGESEDSLNKTEFYWSVALDRLNYLHGKMTHKISLININIDNIFSNTEFGQYYYTLMVYLHTKYMELPARVNGRKSGYLEHFKALDNYSYLDLIEYFQEMYDVCLANPYLKERYLQMIKRYYLTNTYITINRSGLVVD